MLLQIGPYGYGWIFFKKKINYFVSPRTLLSNSQKASPMFGFKCAEYTSWMPCCLYNLGDNNTLLLVQLGSWEGMLGNTLALFFAFFIKPCLLSKWPVFFFLALCKESLARSEIAKICSHYSVPCNCRQNVLLGLLPEGEATCETRAIILQNYSWDALICFNLTWVLLSIGGEWCRLQTN